MTTPRRYVRVRMLTHHGALARWECEFCGGAHGIHWTADGAHENARAHAASCPAVAAAMERDRLQQVIDTQLGGCSCHPDGDDYWDERCALHGWSYRDWTDVADDLKKELAEMRDIRDRFAAELARLAAELTRLRAELDRMRADRNRLRDRLHTAINFDQRGAA